MNGASYLIEAELGIRFCYKKSLQFVTNIVSAMRTILEFLLQGALSNFAVLRSIE